ncbi:MAG: peptidoglycan DD-metalloendopeptidase family protein [Clostridia bacterium]|nr:peptidoglycan DD-metalloendopeptidase family protein [Clostridia bacterium]MCL6521620.1 peptidoglycan DD-metalloendopeptidase family protein [Bacillota bacterium]
MAGGLAALLLALAVLAPAPGVRAGSTSSSDPGAILQEIQRTQQRLSQMQSQASRTRQQLSTVQSRAAAAQSKLNQLRQQLQVTRQELARRQNELAQARQRLDQLQAALAAAQARLESQQQRLGDRLRATYEAGTVSYLEVLLAARNFADFVTRFQLLERIVAADVDLLHQVQAQRAEVARQTQLQEQQVARISELTRQVASAKQALDQKTAQQQQVTLEYQQSAAELQAALDEEERASQEVQAELQRLQRQYEEALRLSGAVVLEWPLSSFVVTSTFGSRYHPILKQWRMHTGMDLAAPSGTPIHAAAPGVVFYAGWMSGYGNTVILVHGNGISTLYGHMSQILVQANQQVSAGQVIGLVGMTGLATGPHLHFEVRVNGTPVNPQDYVGRVIR